jgi:ApaG protein
MKADIAQNIHIEVAAYYMERQSMPASNDFVFAYRVVIHNASKHTVQLLRRHWYIYDGNGNVREVEGEGVVGETPILETGEHFEYSSGCNIKTDYGCMKGYYTFLDLHTKKNIRVEIPAFKLVTPFKLN